LIDHEVRRSFGVAVRAIVYRAPGIRVLVPSADAGRTAWR
jgi:hypothetical protein